MAEQNPFGLALPLFETNPTLVDPSARQQAVAPPLHTHYHKYGMEILVPTQTDEKQLIRQRMVEFQQSMLGNNYDYFLGDEKQWPNCPVGLTKENKLLLMSPFTPHALAQAEPQWTHLSSYRNGLLLVGLESCDHPAVRHFIASHQGTIAYVNARTLEYSLRRSTRFADPPKILSHGILRKLAKHIQNRRHDIDCLQFLKRDIQHSVELIEFQRKAQEITGGRKAFFSWVMIGLCIATFLLGLVHNSNDVAITSYDKKPY